MNISINIPTYNGVQRIKLLLSSIFAYTNFDDLNAVTINVVDDGTPYIRERDKLYKICDKFDVNYIQHEKNMGISASWNTLVNRSENADIYILLNDDIQICHKDWLKYLIYFFENNKMVGTVSFPVFYLDPRTSLPQENCPIPNINQYPQKTSSPNGQAFAFRKKMFYISKFNEDLVSFYEECDWGFDLAFRGYMSYILPFPVVQHWGSQTFGQNPELAYTEPIPQLPMQKYREILIKHFPIEKIEPKPGKVYRMEYSRVLFALKWNCSDYWDKPQDEVEKKLQEQMTIKSCLISWLDKDGNQRKTLV